MFARTERLLLRPGWAEDAAALVGAIGYEAVIRNLGTVPYPYGLSDAVEFLALPGDPLLPRLLIFARTAAGPRLIGSIGLHEGPSGFPEFGYWLTPSAWGQGFATEAGHAMLAIADVLGHRRLFACHAADNPPSGAVLRKLGFEPTGVSMLRHSRGRDAMVETLGFERRREAVRALAA